MKKTYQYPAIKIASVQPAQIINSSPGYGGTTNQTHSNFTKEREENNSVDGGMGSLW